MNIRSLAALIFISALVACGGGGSNPTPISPTSPPQTAPPTVPPTSPPTVPPTAPPTTPPTTAPSPGAVSVAPSSLAFLGTGSSQTQTITASEPNFAGTFTAGNTCAAIATVAAHPGSTTSFDVTPIAAGTCNLVVTGAPGQSQSVAITITTTSVGGS
ncbi:MAG: hypothetical protein M3Y21_02435 [Candidatus Eremiobacteraeota bacterium]|nr:hypothetical protein [Candidatus Eremiobacteraeota bacterium]